MSKYGGDMPLRPTTLRFSELAYNLIHEEAQHQGMPVAQYIREAALIRTVIDRVERGATVEDGLSIEDLARKVRRLAANSDGPREGGPSETAE